MLAIEKVSITGEMVLTFNQPMFFPAEMKDFNYTELLQISLVSAKNGRIIKAQEGKQRNLRDASWCPEKQLISMSSVEKMDLFSELEYDDDHTFAHCKYGEKRKWFG